MAHVEQRSKHPPLREVWMQVRDRKVLAKIMTIQHVSSRQLAAAAGWSAHSYVNRLLSGEKKTLRLEPAVRIAKYLGVGVDDLFLAKTSSETGQAGTKSARKSTKTPPKAGDAA